MRWFSFFVSLAGSIAAGALGMAWLRAGLSRSSGPLSWGGHTMELGAYALLGALVFGCLAGLLILRQRGRYAAPLLLACGLLPGLIEPKAFVVTFVLVLAAFLPTGAKSKRGNHVPESGRRALN